MTPVQKAPNGWTEIAAWYGWDAKYLTDLGLWERKMVLVPPPQGYGFWYDADADGVRDLHEGTRGIRVHEKVAPLLSSVFSQLVTAGLWDEISCVGGGYAFRTQRGASKLSVHALGGAVDFNPRQNGLGVPPQFTAFGKYPGTEVVKIFEANGWQWGGRWKRPDAMHFQFATGF